MAFWTYILLCADGLYYTGHTDDLEKRIGQHQSGMIEGFTSSRLPARLMWSQDFPTRYEALDAELKIKKWSKAKKQALIRGDWDSLSHFAKPPKERNQSNPVRVERSRDTTQDSAAPIGLSTSLEANGLMDKQILNPVRVERSRDTPPDGTQTCP
jgi:putative endonuclease